MKKFRVHYAFRKHGFMWARYKYFSTVVEAKNARAAKRAVRNTYKGDGILVINDVQAEAA